MRKLFDKIKSTLKKGLQKIKNGINQMAVKWSVRRHAIATDCAGEGYIDTAIKIIIALVIGALLLGGLYTLFNSSVIPTMQTKVTDMFSYSGT